MKKHWVDIIAISLFILLFFGLFMVDKMIVEMDEQDIVVEEVQEDNSTEKG